MRIVEISLLILIFSTLGLCSCNTHMSSMEIIAGEKQIYSPNKQFALECVANESKKMYEIWVTIKLSGGNFKKQLVFEYERNVSILWSPDSNKLLVNCHTGSGFVDIYLFRLDKNIFFIEDKDLEQLVRDKITNPILKGGVIDHLYTTGEKWIDKNIFVARANGYGSKTQVDFKYKVNLETQEITKIE